MKPERVRQIQIQNPMTGLDLDIYWDHNFEVDLLGYNVYRDQAAAGLFEDKLNSELLGVDFFRDTTALTRHAVEYYYTVTAVNFDGEESDKQFPVIFDLRAKRPMGYWLQAIIRRHNLLLNFDAERCDILIRRKVGERCSCYDSVKGQSQQRCELCYGTSYLGGYIAIYDVLFRILSPQESLNLTQFGYSMESSLSAWLSTFPRLNNGDVILRRNNKRYEVNLVIPSITQGQLTRQVFTLKELDPSFAVYKYPVKEYAVTLNWEKIVSITALNWQRVFNVVMEFWAPNFIVDDIVIRDPIIGSTSLFLSEDSLIKEYETEILWKVKDLYAQKKRIKTLSLFPDGSFKPNYMLSLTESDKRLIYAVETEGGHIVNIAEPNEFLDKDRRWRSLSELKIGQKIAVLPHTIVSYV
ncbi:MAG: hypothetical protein KJ760_19170 [Proteobacteria bacterium]|nr:hypothetical protein [Pseudomonadota bacterium]